MEMEIAFTNGDVSYDKRHYREEWVLSPDTRHGISGYRVCRYDYYMEWDEHYMFFTSIDTAWQAYDTFIKREVYSDISDLKASRLAF